MTIRVNIRKILTAIFVMLFVTELFFSYTMLSRVMLLLFCGMGFILCHRIFINPFCISYAIFGAWSLMNIFFGHAIDKNVAIEMTMTLALNCVFIFVFTQYCGVMKNPVDILNVYKNICIFASCIFCVVGLPGVLSGERLSVLGINSNVIGTFAAYSLIVHIYEIYRKEHVSVEDVLIFVLFVLVMLFSGSRKALIIPIIGWYVMLCFRKPRKFIKYTVIAMLLVVISIVASLNVEFLYNIIGYRIEPILLFLQGLDYEETSLMTRSHFIQYAWENSQDSMMWGHGLDCFRTLPKAYDTYSHCNYLEILFSTGVIGILIYYGTSVIALVKANKALRYKKKDVELLLAWIIPYLVCDFFSVTYFTRRMIIIPSITIMFLWRYGNERLE